jgi:polyhydroxyalkanoate synthase
MDSAETFGVNEGGADLADIDERSQAAPADVFQAVLTASGFRHLYELVPGTTLLRLGGAVAGNPAPPVRQVLGLARQLADIAVGATGRGAGTFDRRFRDPAWQESPVLRRLVMSYLASCAAAERIVADLDVDWRTKARVSLLLDNVLAAAAPANNPLLNPESLRYAFESRGGSWTRGLLRFAHDFSSRPRLPSMVDDTKFTIGQDIAAQPGKVVARDDLCELIHYRPTTPTVDKVPVLLVASPVNKYYLTDLSPQASVIADSLARGRQMFVTSLVNPDQSHAQDGLDSYVQMVRDSLDAVTAITGATAVHLIGICGGGLIALTATAYLAAIGSQDRVASLTVAAAVVDYEQGGVMAALVDRKTADRAVKRAAKRGFFDGRETAAGFAWIRPNDGVWANVVNNYLLGQPPPAVELLYWAADQTNMTVQFGRDLLDITLDNAFTKPGAMRVLGQPISLRDVTVDTFVLGASTDHITPWTDCYRTRALLGGETTFVLARGGHALAIATPPGKPRAGYRTSASMSADPAEWLRTSTDNADSWWALWHDWIEKRTPARKRAPTRLGNKHYPPLDDAPGSYVLRSLT